MIKITKLSDEFSIHLTTTNDLYWKDNWNEIDWISAAYQYFLSREQDFLLWKSLWQALAFDEHSRFHF